MTLLTFLGFGPVLKVLGKAAGHLAHRLHRDEFHRYAEQCKKRDIEAGYDHFKLEDNEKTNCLVLKCIKCGVENKVEDANNNHCRLCGERLFEFGFMPKLDKLAKVIILAAMLTCSGCASITHAWRVSFVHAHEAIDEVLTEKNQTPPSGSSER